MVPVNPRSAALACAIGPSEWTVKWGNSHNYFDWIEESEPPRNVDLLVEAVLEARFEEAGPARDSHSRVFYSDGTTGDFRNLCTVPIPWAWRRKRYYEPY